MQLFNWKLTYIYIYSFVLFMLFQLEAVHIHHYIFHHANHALNMLLAIFIVTSYQTLFLEWVEKDLAI